MKNLQVRQTAGLIEGSRTVRSVAIAAALACSALAASAQTADPLRNAVEKALQTNPEVAARFNAYRAADDAIDVVRGGFLPRLDLDASVGKDRTSITSRVPETQTVNRTGIGLTLSQLLWDGLATSNDVNRLSHEKRARYFELIDTADQIALEVARAYYDVLRYRRLVELAEDNYVQHKYVSLQIGKRTRAGVDRSVNLEQANARLALAESNLTTELANLHDVTARYQRLVGDSPPPTLPIPGLLQQSVPNNATEATTQAIRRNPAISAAIESLRAARSTVKIREAAFQPRVEARLRGGGGKNYQGVVDQDRNATAEIVMSWNLFAGGSDRARVRQQVDLVNQAADVRDRTCREVRQTAAIAFNDTRKLTEQLTYLDRNTTAITSARDAYRIQFDNSIAGRTLLDLLNSENEVYTARRSLANAQYDQGLAYVRTQAAMSSLISSLGLAKPNTGANDEAGWSAGADAPARCPVLVPDVPPSKKTELDQRADDMAQANPGGAAITAPTVPAMTPAPSAMPPAPPPVPQRGTRRN
ncbi:TolC family outer membrane protein [Piscinibacter sakaiensis]|uniref:TolC family outer membrane protein n=1 Tax=Piscinibacter sakaiensis TaxID=1547922 RepID=UPI003AB0706F